MIFRRMHYTLGLEYITHTKYALEQICFIKYYDFDILAILTCVHVR